MRGHAADHANDDPGRVAGRAAVIGGLAGAAVVPCSLVVAVLLMKGRVNPAMVPQLTALLLTWVGVSGVAAAVLGEWLGDKVRRRRHAEWSKVRTAGVGAFAVGLVMPACCVIPLLAWVG